MSTGIEYLSNMASVAEVAEHLSRCDADFVPPLSDRVEISDYAQTITRKAVRFEAWSGDILVGLLAVYCNDQETRAAYITSVSVLKTWTRRGIAARLVRKCIKHATDSGMRQIGLEVGSSNASAIKLYEKSGFVAGKANTPFASMTLYLDSGEEHE
mgnify:CR=1 FL=1